MAFNAQQILGPGRHTSDKGPEGKTPIQSDTKNLCLGTYRDYGVKEGDTWLKQVLSVVEGDQSQGRLQSRHSHSIGGKARLFSVDVCLQVNGSYVKLGVIGKYDEVVSITCYADAWV